MTSNRSYRKGLPQSVVRSEIEKGKGTQFDPDIADIMLQIIDEDKEYTLRQIERTEYKILMVGEDSECNQRVKDILQKDSIYEVIIQNTVNVESVLEKCKENSFELILLDIQMDKGNDWKIIQSIKDKYEIPIIVMFDDKNLKNTKEFKESGCDDYMTKAFSSMMLNEIIYNMLKKSL
jgi:DNA-binding NtrC family response regulator